MKQREHTPGDTGSERAPILSPALVAVLIIAAGLAMLLMLWRLQYGVAFTDEAYYIAMPYRFVLGDTPFADELMIHQTAGLMTTPLVWLWVKLVGSTNAIVLFMRVMWFLFASGVAFAAYRFFVRLFPRSFAFLLSTVYVAFMPFAIPGLSYNTLSSGCLTIGLALFGMNLLDDDPRWSRALAAGIFHGLAIVAYPTMIVVVPVVIAGLAIAARGVAKRQIWTYLAGLAGVGALFGLFVAVIGAQYLAGVFEFTRSASTFLGGSTKLAQIAAQIEALGMRSLLAQAALLCGIIIASRRATWAWLLLPLLPLAVLVLVLPHNTGTTLLWIPLFGIAALALLPLESSKPLRNAAVVIAPTSIVAGMTISYTSTNGFINVGLGMAPILLIALPLVFLPAVNHEAVSDSRRLAAISTALAVPLILGLVGANYLRAYDSPGVFPLNMTARVSTGPWAYLYGLDGSVQLAEEIQADADEYVTQGSTVLFYSPIYGGYLATKARPAAPSIMFGMADPGSPSFPESRAAMMREYSRAPLPDYVFRPNRPDVSSEIGNPLWYLTEETEYRRIVHREQYDVYERVE